MPTITWDSGTAYDLIISLHVLHKAGSFGLRPSWAAGVRQRISASRREFLEKTFSYCGSGLEWISSLPAPKDAGDILQKAAQLDPARFFESMVTPGEVPASVRESMHAIHARRAARTADREILKANFTRRGAWLKSNELENLVSACMDLNASGEQYLAALQEYYEVFFAEEEQRLRSVLADGLEHAQSLAGQVPVDVLIEKLTRGVRLDEVASVRKLVLAPSYWVSPLVFHVKTGAHQTLIVFGVRPGLQSLVPGTDTPSLLIATLKALADPTRLQILRFLYQEQVTQAELARRLRLRPPTITHHLQALRLAGLVQITITANNERQYAPRLEALHELGFSLQEFLTHQELNEQHP